MAKVNINFIGPWRLFLGVRTITADINSIDEARDCIETKYGPVYNKKMLSKGVKAEQSVSDSSNILLNGRNIKQLEYTLPLESIGITLSHIDTCIYILRHLAAFTTKIAHTLTNLLYLASIAQLRQERQHYCTRLSLIYIITRWICGQIK